MPINEETDKIILYLCNIIFQEVLKMAVEHVKGKNAGTIMLYALSTCGWCHKTKELLTSLGVEFDYTYVDLLPDTERETTLKTVEKWNPKTSFPTIIINNNCIVGFKEDEIKKALKL
jgi:glutaredoxin